MAKGCILFKEDKANVLAIISVAFTDLLWSEVELLFQLRAPNTLTAQHLLESHSKGCVNCWTIHMSPCPEVYKAVQIKNKTQYYIFITFFILILCQYCKFFSFFSYFNNIQF